MQATPRRDPKRFAQKTMAAAIAASALAVSLETSAQTTGGGIGANVNSNAGASGNLPTQGTTGAAGSTTSSGVAAPNAPANPLRPGTGPGINNTGSPALSTPPNLRTPIGGGGGRTGRGTSRIPGNTVPVNPRLQPRATTGVNGATVPQPTTAPTAPVTGATTLPRVPNDTLGANVGGAAARPGANLRTGTITDFTDTTITFREGANSTTLTITPDTVIQMDGRNVALRDLPANSTVRVERDASNPNQIVRIVAVPQAAATGAANANANAAGNTVQTQTGTGSTGSANRSLSTTGGNDTGSVRGGTSVNTQTGTGSTGSANQSLQDRASVGSFGGATSAAGTGASARPFAAGDINAGTNNASVPNRDINAPTANASTPGGDINAPVVNEPNVSNRPLAPGSTNPADQPVSPFTRGAETRLQAGFNEPATQNQQNQTPSATTDGSRFLGPAVTDSNAKPNRTPSGPTVDTGANTPITLPDSGTTPVGQDPSNRAPNAAEGKLFTDTLSNRLGMRMNDSNRRLTVGSVTNQSLAGRAGLRAGDHIQSLNGTNVTTAADFGRALQTANQGQGPITASVLRNGTPQEVTLTLPNGFFNGMNVPQAAGTGGTAVTGAGNVAVTPDGQVGVNANGVFVPATGQAQTAQTQVGATGVAGAGAAVGTTAAPEAQSTTVQERTVVQGQAPARVRPVDPPVATSKTGVTTEALKVPDINLGWTLKATPEGVVMSSIVEDGLAAKNLFQPGDIIETIDGRPITAPGAVSYELHRHRANANVEFGILRKGQRITEDVTLPASHEPLLLNRNETFGQANNDAKEQGGSGARPVPVKPTEESIRTLEAENKALRQELESLRKKK